MCPEITVITNYRHLWAVVSYFWALVSYLRFCNVKLYIELLRKLLITYPVHEVINLQNIESWNWEIICPYRKIDAKSF